MCGRFTLAARLEQLRERFEIQKVSTDYTPEYQAYNIAPTQEIPIIRLNTREEPMIELLSAKWGYNIGTNTVINSRDDKIATTKTYYKALESNRCLIPATGFYEWKTEGTKKQPYYFTTTDQELYSFAGFYQLMPPTVDYRAGCTILTTKPNDLVKEIHDRMPVILEKRSESLWLDQKAGEEDLLECLKPYPAEKMQKIEVAMRVNSTKNNTADLIKPKTKLDSYF